MCKVCCGARWHVKLFASRVKTLSSFRPPRAFPMNGLSHLLCHPRIRTPAAKLHGRALRPSFFALSFAVGGHTVALSSACFLAAIGYPGDLQIALKRRLTGSLVRRWLSPSSVLQPACDHSHETSNRSLPRCPFIAGLSRWVRGLGATAWP
jgi:hypothetical protein